MKPQLFALLTAMAWGIGGYYEKKGLHLGHLSPEWHPLAQGFTDFEGMYNGAANYWTLWRNFPLNTKEGCCR